MSRNLPLGDAADASQTAHEVGERLLDAFFHQDLREDCLLCGDVAGARAAAETATTAMSTVFCAEFPGRPRRHAERAGATFVRALFLQDEIENWAAVESTRSRLPPDLVLTCGPAPTGGDVLDDPRWDDVRDLLTGVCSDAGIDETYARRQTEFWRRHGQREAGWRRTALAAHRLKVTAMVPRCPDEEVERLARQFVRGVELHDEWSRADRDRDFDEIRDVVAAYYQRVFELRGKIPRL
jgi:hypothetical protein